MISYKRRETKLVKVGKINIGSGNKIVSQSMTNTDTFDIPKTVEQVILIADAGADMVRITAQNVTAAQNLSEIKAMLRAKGYDLPLVADIHFSPKAAEVAATVVEKVRVNPGNYTDTKKFDKIEFSDQEYQAEIEKIREKFVPLIEICKQHQTALRIGANHGSLSDRIMSKYGDTPLGMVESTMEFLRICVENDFSDIVISMKASNPIVMIHACRLLILKMNEENMNFPVHLGVTEAGEGIAGRVKSVTGISTLLADGIGDTIRVSLTENPENELAVVKRIIDTFNENTLKLYTPPNNNLGIKYDLYSYKRRVSVRIGNIGGDKQPVVVVDLSKQSNETNFNFEELIPDYVFCNDSEIKYNLPSNVIRLIESNNYKSEKGTLPVFEISGFLKQDTNETDIRFVKIKSSEISGIDFDKLKQYKNIIIVAEISDNHSIIHAGRFFFAMLENKGINFPVITKFSYNEDFDNTLVKASGHAGALLVDGMGDGIWLDTTCTPEQTNNLSFEILQACRTRISKTEYISCPSCGRTLFDLQKTSAKIREKTQHLKHLKIGIMGCIVNGPGEMADADYGYVGTGKGKVTLYKKQEAIKKNIPEEYAVEELLSLIEQFEKA